MRHGLALFLITVLASAGCARQAPPTRSGDGLVATVPSDARTEKDEPVLAGDAATTMTEKDKELLAGVSANLIAVCPRPEGFEWPPVFGFDAEPAVKAGAWTVRKNGKAYPVVRVTEQMMTKVIAGDAHRLAFVLGHELGHIVKGHLLAKPERDRTPFLRATFERPEEIEADLFGFELLVAANYSFEKGMKAITRMQELNLDYASFEGLGGSHPSWNERAVKADKDKAHLWRAMAAFKNGVLFLATEDYPTAIDCFKKVTAAFPNCHEAWANLGYARLMRYCDEWDKKDVRDHGIGHVVVGGFYARIRSVTVRGKKSELWFDAVGALREAHRLSGGQKTIVLANLGLAYLLHPDGKDVGAAGKWFAMAVEAAKTDKDLGPVAHAALLINLGVNALAADDPEKALAQLDEGAKAVRSFAGPASRKLAPSFDAALLYTRALALGEKQSPADKQKAVDMFAEYLFLASPRSLWWDAGYDRYVELCLALGQAPKPKAVFQNDRPKPIRLVTGVSIKGVKVTLGDDIDKVVEQIGKGQKSCAVHGTNLSRIRYVNEGIELLANSDDVLAIILVGPAAPALPLDGNKRDAGQPFELKIGMSADEVQQLLGVGSPCEIVEAGTCYQYFREQGVAVRFDRPFREGKFEGKVIEMVVVQIPKR